MVVHGCNPSTQVLKAEESEVQGRLGSMSSLGQSEPHETLFLFVCFKEETGYRIHDFVAWHQIR